ncbi:hypothetical protein, partial [Raoultella sp. 18093]|uniref:hypothetical protein n=1 Tax=Raoultella sp. 18093 TaxID=2681425 RepID=UPI001D114D27
MAVDLLDGMSVHSMQERSCRERIVPQLFTTKTAKRPGPAAARPALQPVRAVPARETDRRPAGHARAHGQHLE